MRNERRAVSHTLPLTHGLFHRDDSRSLLFFANVIKQSSRNTSAMKLSSLVVLC